MNIFNNMLITGVLAYSWTTIICPMESKTPTPASTQDATLMQTGKIITKNLFVARRLGRTTSHQHSLNAHTPTRLRATSSAHETLFQTPTLVPVPEEWLTADDILRGARPADTISQSESASAIATNPGRVQIHQAQPSMPSFNQVVLTEAPSTAAQSSASTSSGNAVIIGATTNSLRQLQISTTAATSNGTTSTEMLNWYVEKIFPAHPTHTTSQSATAIGSDSVSDTVVVELHNPQQPPVSLPNQVSPAEIPQAATQSSASARSTQAVITSTTPPSVQTLQTASVAPPSSGITSAYMVPEAPASTVIIPIVQQLVTHQQRNLQDHNSACHCLTPQRERVLVICLGVTCIAVIVLIIAISFR